MFINFNLFENYPSYISVLHWFISLNYFCPRNVFFSGLDIRWKKTPVEYLYLKLALYLKSKYILFGEWLGRAMVLGSFQSRGVLLLSIW